MVRFLLLAVVVLFGAAPSVGNAQLSRGALDTIRRAQQRSARAEAAWNESKKLILSGKIPDFPHSQAECVRLEEMAEGVVGYFDCWQFKVLQVVDNKNVLLSLGPRVMWLKGYPAKGLVDDQLVRLVGLVEFKETKTYTTAAGTSSTVRVLSLITKERTTELAVEQFKVRWEKEKHDWKYKTGKTVTAVYESDLGGGNIRLLKEDQKPVDLHLSKLADPDRRKAIALRRAANDAKKRELRKSRPTRKKRR